MRPLLFSVLRIVFNCLQYTGRDTAHHTVIRNILRDDSGVTIRFPNT